MAVLSEPPPPEKLEHCVALYRHAALRSELPKQVTIAWEEDLADGLLAYSTDRLGSSYGLAYDDVLVFDPGSPEMDRSDFDLRPIEPKDWSAMSTMALQSDGFVADGSRDWLLGERSQLVEAGRGLWWGAWNDKGELAAACGAFGDKSLLRLDQLIVDPRFRRQGLSGWLTQAIARRSGNRTVVMEPTRGSWRSTAYQRVGYRPVGRTAFLMEISSDC